MKWSYFSLIFLFGNFISACQSTHIHLHGTIHKPYCGGARPTEEQAQGITIAASKMVFSVFEQLGAEQKFIKNIFLDENGDYNGDLKEGQYYLKRIEKTWEIPAINAHYLVFDTLFYRPKGEKAITQWRTEADASFDTKKGKLKLEVNIPLTEKCFVGLNPCIEYIGPKPH